MVAAEYQEHFGEHAYDQEGNYVGFTEDSIASDADEAWAEYYAEQSSGAVTEDSAPSAAADTADASEPDPQAEFTYAVRDAHPAGDKASNAKETDAEEAGEEADTGEAAAEEAGEEAMEVETSVEETTEAATAEIPDADETPESTADASAAEASEVESEGTTAESAEVEIDETAIIKSEEAK